MPDRRKGVGMTARRRETKRPLVLPGMCCLCILLLTSSPGVSAAADPRPEVEAAMQEAARLMEATAAVRPSGSYTPDGELLEPGMEALKGPAAIRKFLESFGSVKIESASMTPETTEVFGNQAFQWGTYAQR